MIKRTFESISIPFHLYGGNVLPPQLTAIKLFQHINPCSFSRNLEISLKFSVNITYLYRSWIMCKMYSNRTPRQSFRRLRTFCLFCKMVINQTILMAISLSNRSCPYELNASIDYWLKTTSHYDVIAPSTVPITQNAKLFKSQPVPFFDALSCNKITAHGGVWNTSATHQT